MKTTFCYVGVLFCRFVITTVEGGFNNSPHTTSIHENHDDAINLWTISATCNVRYTTAYTSRYQTDGCFIGWCSRTAYRTSYRHEYTDVACDSCWISDSSNNFEIVGTFTLRKKTCSSHTCSGSSCSSTAGCVNGGSSHSITVYCQKASDYETTGQISHTFSVSVTNAAAPTFYYTESSSINAYKGSAVGTVINTISASVNDDAADYDYIRYVQNSGPGNSYIHRTADLFALDTSTGQVKINKDLDLEFSYYFTMNLCVYDRRSRYVCHDLDITLHACFQTPNCTDRAHYTLHDTFGTYTGHGGGSDVFLTMSYPEPTGHFTDFSTVWHDLTWTFDVNEFPEAAINPDNGNIYVTRNISIWPAWPTKQYHQTVRVSNSESCYTTTCDMTIVVHYTNWPIEITSLPHTRYLHEDTDARRTIHNLVVYDYNYEHEDNVTCTMTNISPDESNLFYLHHDGNFARDSYRIIKLACQDPDCGYKPENYLCDLNIGCMNHNLTQTYVITIYCHDAYNTSDTQDLTFRVVKNQAPTYTNLANHIDLDRSKISHLDIVFSILYSDAENERLYYEYTYENGTGYDPGFFLGSPSGNYYNDLSNITMQVYLADKDVNTTYTIHICGHERRNEICDDLTIDIEEYCGESPACNGASISVNTEFTIGDTLFDISTLVTGPTLGTPYKGLSYAITSSDSALFEVDSSTGIVTTRAELTTNFPTSLQKTHTLIGFVYDQGACSYGTCTLVVNVTAVNYALQIDNLPNTVSIHEDTLNTETLFTVLTSDDNADDTYECSIVNTLSVEPFYLERVPAVTGFFELRNRNDYPLSTATLTYTISIMCEDSQGEGDTQELTIEVTENDPPTLTNLGSPTTQSMNPLDYSIGDTAYIVEATDTEGDDLTFTCTVDTNYNPFECYQEDGWNYVMIIFRRNLHVYNDDGEIESIDVCVSDAKHTDASCGTLTVTFTRTLTPPEITNLPDIVHVAEDIAVGDVIFTPVITDPDAGETHVVSISVNPNSHSNKFQLDTSTGVLTLGGGGFNYENVNYYEVLFNVRDDHLDALTTKMLVINVTNVNEGNTMTASITSITFYENMTANSMFEDLGIVCTDIDADQTTISITSGVDSDHFGFDPISHRLSLATEFDYEVDATSVLLTLTCTDGEFDSSVVIELNILDVNDNAPTLVATLGDVNTPIAISPSTPLSEILVSVSASDADTGSNDDFEFIIAGRGIAYRYFRMIKQSSSEADLKLNRIPDFSNEKTFPITILACDNFGGTEDECSGLTFTVEFTPSDPDDKSQEPTKCTTCTTSGRTFIAVLIIEGVIIVVFIVHFIYSIFCRRNEVVKLSDFDKSHNVRFKAKNFTPSTIIPMSRRPPPLPVTTGTTINPVSNKPQQTKQRSRRDDLSSSDSSSSSSSSDDDDVITQRNDIGRGRFQQKSFASVGLPPPIAATSSTGLPPPLYSSRAGAALPFHQ